MSRSANTRRRPMRGGTGGRPTPATGRAIGRAGHRTPRCAPVLLALGVLALGVLAGCAGSGDTDDAVATVDTGTAAPASATTEQRDAVRRAADSYLDGLAELQTTGREALAPGGDPAEFYAEYAAVVGAAGDDYRDLTVPPEMSPVRDRLVDLLDEQAALLGEIADDADAGGGDRLDARLERVTELLGDIATTNAELLRSIDAAAPTGA